MASTTGAFIRESKNPFQLLRWKDGQSARSNSVIRQGSGGYGSSGRLRNGNQKRGPIRQVGKIKHGTSKSVIEHATGGDRADVEGLERIEVEYKSRTGCRSYGV